MTNIHIKKIQLKNFKGFKAKTIPNLHAGVNVLIGDNDTGKSTILLAIDLALGANPNRVESIGFDKLFNINVVQEFLGKSERSFADLPSFEIDLYINDRSNENFVGEYNLAQADAAGICLRCFPKDELRDDLEALVKIENIAFPYEFYTVEIKTFSGKTLTPFNKLMKHLRIDNTKISNEYASKAYIRQLYLANSTDDQRNKLKHDYRGVKRAFSDDRFTELNEATESDYLFGLRNDVKANLETDLTITDNGIDIDSMGVGRQCFIRTSFAISKTSNIDVVLLEEPENHLSHKSMGRLIEEIQGNTESQLFIATHNSMILSRLDLRHAVILGNFEDDPVKLDDLPPDTAEFFMKAPNSSILEFALSKKNILVEGDAEYILLPALYMKEAGEDLKNTDTHVISVNGTSFPRYLDIAKLLTIKTVVITDNDHNFESKVTARYESYITESNIAVYADTDNERHTFEVCVYQDNTDICEGLFAEGRRSLSVQDYMLSEKSKVAFELSTKKAKELNTPQYIKDAISWIRN